MKTIQQIMRAKVAEVKNHLERELDRIQSEPVDLVEQTRVMYEILTTDTKGYGEMKVVHPYEVIAEGLLK